MRTFTKVGFIEIKTEIWHVVSCSFTAFLKLSGWLSLSAGRVTEETPPWGVWAPSFICGRLPGHSPPWCWWRSGWLNSALNPALGKWDCCQTRDGNDVLKFQEITLMENVTINGKSNCHCLWGVTKRKIYLHQTHHKIKLLHFKYEYLSPQRKPLHIGQYTDSFGYNRSEINSRVGLLNRPLIMEG